MRICPPTMRIACMYRSLSESHSESHVSHGIVCIVTSSCIVRFFHPHIFSLFRRDLVPCFSFQQFLNQFFFEIANLKLPTLQFLKTQVKKCYKQCFNLVPPQPSMCTAFFLANRECMLCFSNTALSPNLCALTPLGPPPFHL